MANQDLGPSSITNNYRRIWSERGRLANKCQYVQLTQCDACAQHRASHHHQCFNRISSSAIVHGEMVLIVAAPLLIIKQLLGILCFCFPCPALSDYPLAIVPCILFCRHLSFSNRYSISCRAPRFLAWLGHAEFSSTPRLADYGPDVIRSYTWPNACPNLVGRVWTIHPEP